MFKLGLLVQRQFAVQALIAFGCCVAAAHANSGFSNISAPSGFSARNKAAFADYNSDGWIDLYAGGTLYRNTGASARHGVARFEIARNSGLSGGAGIWGDYDNDGKPDFFKYSEGELYHNIGDGRFERVPFPARDGIESRAAAWLDIDNDARLDLYVAGYEIYNKTVYPDVIYRNTGSPGKKRFVTHWTSQPGDLRSARGVTTADYNDDGKTDIYVSNYRLQPNTLWRSDGNGKFENTGYQTGAEGLVKQKIRYVSGLTYGVTGHSIGSAFGDFDNDSLIDLLVANFSHAPKDQDRSQFLRNQGPERGYQFQNRNHKVKLQWQESYASAALADYDNDGRLDYFLTTAYAKSTDGQKNYPVLYRNLGKWKFQEQSTVESLSKLGPGYQAAWADFDNDGSLDLVTDGKLFINSRRAGNWIGISLSGDGRRVNMSAIGAVVRIKVPVGKTLTRQVEGATGEGNQNDTRLHFGLGKHKAPVSVEIRWPGGFKTVVDNLKTAQYHSIQFK